MESVYQNGTAPVENIRQAEVKKTKTLLGRMPLSRGMVTWECDLMTGLVVPAKVESVVRVIDGKGVSVREVIVRENCMYDRAINAKNAVRKFTNRLLKK